MKKYYVYLIMLILCIVMVNAVQIDNGQTVSLKNITKCDGPVRIKITSDDDIRGIKVEECTRCLDNESIEEWECECHNSFNLRLTTDDNVKTNIDLNVQYFIEYVNYIKGTNGTPSKSEIQYMNNQRRINLYNLKISDGSKESYDVFNNTSVINVLMSIIGIIIIILVVLIKFGFQSVKSDPDDKDILNYHGYTSNEKMDDKR